MKNRVTFPALIAVTVLVASAMVVASASAENWPQFRGPNSTGVSREKNLPSEWNNENNVAWKAALPGRAWSCPIVWGERIFVTTAISEDEQENPKKGLYFGGERLKPRDTVYSWDVLCLSRDNGKVLWRKTAIRRKPTSAIHIKNTYASETPVTDGERVYAFFGSAGLFCYDFDGKLIWKKDLGTLSMRLGWGTASSPVLDDERVFLQCDNEDQSFVVALNKRTGEEVWREDRKEKSSWSTPLVWRTKGRTELITCASRKTRSYDPATGRMLWELSGHSVICCPTPIANDELLYVSSGYILDIKQPLYAIRPGSHGDITPKQNETTSEGVVWSQRRAGAYNPSPVLYGGYVYVLYDRGHMACYDAKTGELIYRRKRLTGGAGFSASPWAYDDKIFCLSEDGDTYVVGAGREFKILGKNSLGEMCMASPAISDGSLLIRTLNHLYCIRKPAK